MKNKERGSPKPQTMKTHLSSHTSSHKRLSEVGTGVLEGTGISQVSGPLLTQADSITEQSPRQTQLNLTTS